MLVVEDNDEVRQFSTELLEDLGYSVKRVANANAALAILAEDEFAADLVFSDVIMPGMNGVELAGIIRELSRPAGRIDQRLQRRTGRKCPSRLRIDPEAISVKSLSRILRKAISEQRSVHANRALHPCKGGCLP